ncbi:MAG TPA: GNAT family N-acetyltransferase [Myxococcaceae bacterium]|nr:GNAT family N-acetyltransferase [Myxococcaceae bacterium]
MEIRAPNPNDREALHALIRRIETFDASEIAHAGALIDLTLDAPDARHPDYQMLVADRGGSLVGYVCYGPTPMTEGTFDLYWIASVPEVRGQGIGGSLVAAMEGDLRRRNARQVRVESSASEAYGPTRGFYEALHYVEEARFRDFYAVGDDLIILRKKL